MPDSPPYAILAAALAAASSALEATTGGSPDRALIVDADPDWDECCGTDGKGRLAVWGEPITPLNDSGGKCATIYSLDVVVQILRCADSATDDAWQAMARALWEDIWALIRSVCTLQQDGWTVRVRNAGPVGEEGGCIAGELRMSITIRPRGQ